MSNWVIIYGKTWDYEIDVLYRDDDDMRDVMMRCCSINEHFKQRHSTSFLMYNNTKYEFRCFYYNQSDLNLSYIHNHYTKKILRKVYIFKNTPLFTHFCKYL